MEGLGRLSRGTVRYRPFDWQGGHGIADTEVHPRPRGLIVVEGVHSPRPELAHLESLAVLVEAHRDERLRRIAGVDRRTRPGTRWYAADDHYLRDVRRASRSISLLPSIDGLLREVALGAARSLSAW